MKSKNRVPAGYREGTRDWDDQYNMLLDDGVTCNDCAHVERCCSIFGQTPYVNSGRCQFYPNRFKATQAGEPLQKNSGGLWCGDLCQAHPAEARKIMDEMEGGK